MKGEPIMAETTNLNETVKGVKITKTVSIKPDGDTPDDEKKTITLAIDFDGVTLASVFESAVRSDVIKWQGNNRDNFNTIENGSTITRKFAAPPVAVVTDEMAKAAMLAKLSKMTKEEQEKYFDEMLEMVTTM